MSERESVGQCKVECLGRWEDCGGKKDADKSKRGQEGLEKGDEDRCYDSIPLP